ncbi:ATP-binding protein [Streptomyces sp. NPDC048197]|uniref:ATP-binding protein n=1 Tax=Streptomyces sp. NPDC048197 TaxID=3365511 RepID=UPI00371028C4
MTHHITEAVSWCITAVTLPALPLLIRQHRITATLRRHLTSRDAGLLAREEEVRHLVEARLPALAEASLDTARTAPAPVPGPLDPGLAGATYGRNLQRITEQFTEVMQAAQARADTSAKAALKAAMRALQALANEQQLAISDMQDRHDDPDVLQDLLEIDHANAQFGRRAQAITVLCGSWIGRQRAASPVLDVVRGATSRIRDYRRVQVHSRVDMDVASRAVEPVVLAVAELLDNAARHSQPNTTVEVGIQPAHNGVSIVVDDAGVGMDAREAEEAARRLSGHEEIDINRLGVPPQFGFAVIGMLAARYGFSVSVNTQSPYGGVRAVLFLPNALLNRVRFMGPPIPTQGSERPPAPEPASPPTPEAEAVGDAAAQPGPGKATARPSVESSPLPEAEAAPSTTAGGLPKRRRRTPQHQAAGDPAAPTGSDPALVRPAAEAASRMSAFARGTRFGRDASPDSEGNAQE